MAQALAAIVVAVIAFGSAEARPRSPGQADASLPAARSAPGTLLDYQRIKMPAFYRAKAWRVRYVTRDYALRPILSTGLVVLPDRAPRIPMERRFVAWAHPTTGVARKCAPSLRTSPTRAIAGLDDLVSAGLVVAATDYPGLGTEGPVGYLVGSGQAYALIDSVRAARQIPGVGGGGDFALWGYSQGGHAALFAAGLARRYAPELTLKGVAAVAPPTDLVSLLRADIGTIPGRILTSFTLSSWSVKYGLPLAALLDDAAARLVAAVATSCVDDLGGQLDALASQKGLKQRFLRADPSGVPPWDTLLMKNSMFALNGGVPALIVQGDADDIVRPPVTTSFVRASCRAGVKVEYVVLKAKGHGGAIVEGAKLAPAWLAARLAGRPPRSTCR